MASLPAMFCGSSPHVRLLIRLASARSKQGLLGIGSVYCSVWRRDSSVNQAFDWRFFSDFRPAIQAIVVARRRGRVLALMRKRLCSILVETYKGQSSAGLSAPATAQPAEVALALREKGWMPYRIRFDPEADVWIAKVIDWGQAA
jgi:hypothetical protein